MPSSGLSKAIHDVDEIIKKSNELMQYNMHKVVWNSKCYTYIGTDKVVGGDK